MFSNGSGSSAWFLKSAWVTSQPFVLYAEEIMGKAQETLRFAEKMVFEALAEAPVVVVQGARHVGKSNLVRRVCDELPEARTFNLDDAATLAIAESDPAFFVNQATEGVVVITEAQRAPELMWHIAASVDKDRRPGRFLLTASADLLQVKGVGKPFADHVKIIELWPFSQGELRKRCHPEDFVHWVLARPQLGDAEGLDPETVVAGGYPDAAWRSPSRTPKWFDTYIAGLAHHDASDLVGGSFSEHMASLLRAIAAGGQQELVKAQMAREIGVSQTAVNSYLNLAVDMRIVHMLPSWGHEPGSRKTRREKIALNDTGFSAAISGFTPDKAATVEGYEPYANLVKQFVTLELAKQQTWSRERFDLYHFRHLDGLEVDLIIELQDGRLIAIEAKPTTLPTERAWENLVRFREMFSDRDIVGVCLHAGEASERIDGWLDVLPISVLWGHEALGDGLGLIAG